MFLLNIKSNTEKTSIIRKISIDIPWNDDLGLRYTQMLSRINANSTSDYQLLLDENKEKLEQIASQTYQSGTTLEETTETLEQEIRELINEQGNLLLGMKLQQILDSEEYHFN